MTALNLPGIDIQTILPAVTVEGFTGASTLAKIQAALNSGAAYVYLKPNTTYVVAGILTVPSGVTLIGEGSVLQDAQIQSVGTVGSEVNITGAVAVGDLTLPFPTTGFSAGDWVYVMGCINVNSTDAGNDQLGPFVSGEYNYFAEFKRIKTIDSSAQATVEGGMMFPYTTSGSTNSGSRSCATVRKVNFSEGAGVNGVKFTGDYSSALEASYIWTNWTKRFKVENCFFDIGTVAKHCFETEQSLEDVFYRNRIRRGAYDATMAGLSSRSAYNSVVGRAAISLQATHNHIDGGYQCLDATFFGPNAPSVNPIFEHNVLRNSRDGATTHNGAFGGSLSFNDCQSDIGVRIRTRNTRVIGNNCQGKGLTLGAGVYLAGGFLEGTVAIGNTCRNFLYGVQVEGADPVTGGPPNGVDVMIDGNALTECAEAIFVTNNTSSNKRLGVAVHNNIVTRFSNIGIHVDDYANGVSVIGNKIVGPAGGSARAGIQFDFNVVDITIARNEMHDLGSGIFTVRGPSSSTSFITDTTTFPGGNADARLILGDNRSFGTDGGQTGIVRDLAAFDSSVRSSGVLTQEGKLVGRQLNSVTNTNVIEAQTSSGSPVFGVTEAGLIIRMQPAVTAKTTSALLTAAELLTMIITVNQGAGAASALQLPTGANIQAALPSNVASGHSFDVSIINISTVAAEAVSITANTNVTIVGSPDIPAYSAVGNNSSALFRFRRNGNNTFIAYRIG